MSKKEFRKWLAYFSFAVACIIVFKTIDSVGTILDMISKFLSVIMPFLMAVLTAYILYMPSKKIENFLNKSKVKYINKHSKGLGILITYLIVALLIFLCFNFILPTIVTSVKELTGNIPTYYNSTMDYFMEVSKDSSISYLNLDGYINKLKETNIIKEFLKLISIEQISQYVKGIFNITSIIFDTFVTVIVSIYMLMERNEIKSFLVKLSKSLFDKKTNEYISKYYNKTNGIFFSYIAGQLLDAIVVGVITGIAMNIMKIKYATLLGFMIGLFNIIPYFGAIIAVVISVIITIFTGGFTKALWLAVVVIVLQQIDANIINPKILGNSLHLSPILIIFSVTVGGTYFGVLGMFLGVPVITFLKLLVLDFIEIRSNIQAEENKS